MIIIKSSTGEDGAVRMECGACDRRRAVVMEETRVRLERRQIGAVNVESLDFMAVGAAAIASS